MTFETWHEDGALVLGNVEVEDRALVLAVDSGKRSDIGRASMCWAFKKLYAANARVRNRDHASPERPR